jgi:radical SAM-linked protein
VFAEPPAVQRLWMRVSRTEQARYLTHLEAMNAWLRALRRAKAPLAYSQGFHPHPKLAFSSAMPQNAQSVGEYMDLTFVDRVDALDFLARLSAVLPEGFGAHAVTEVSLDAPSLMSIVAGAEWTLFFPRDEMVDVEARLAEMLQAAGA